MSPSCVSKRPAGSGGRLRLRFARSLRTTVWIVTVWHAQRIARRGESQSLTRVSRSSPIDVRTPAEARAPARLAPHLRWFGICRFKPANPSNCAGTIADISRAGIALIMQTDPAALSIGSRGDQTWG